MALRTTAQELVHVLSSPVSIDDLATETGGVIVVESAGYGGPLAIPPLFPHVVVLDDDGSATATRLDVDVVADGAVLDDVTATVTAHPQASTALAVLLRGSQDRSVADGLLAESAVYGVLQAGTEFAAWRRQHPVKDRRGSGPPVRASRDGDVLAIELARPDVRNALDAEMRDALAELLVLAIEERSLHVELRGAGPSFSTGGHLDEFGSRPDPATAHLVRLSRNLGWLLHQLADRTHVIVHGPCAGSGVELPAFAGRVTAARDSSFALPEVSMGLIPGAGGTVSLPRRIGRQRTALLALSGRSIDAVRALEWGLIDEIAP